MIGRLGWRACIPGVLLVVALFPRQAAGQAPLALPPPVEEHRLGNGLRVVLAPDDAISDVSLVVRYEAGAADDPDGMEGLAHVTEHVLFGAFRQGAHARLLSQAGATNLNARTSLDFTSFEETVPPEALDLALWLEGARMATATASVDESAVARECTVAGHEYREFGQVGFRIAGPFFDFAWDELYPEWHPYHLPLDALRALDRIDPKDVRAFAATWYAPNNASLVLAGRFEKDRALNLVQRYFGSILARHTPERPELPSLPAPGNLWLDIEALVTHPFAIMVWRGPKSGSLGSRALTLAVRLLAASPRSLVRQFVEGEGAALRITLHHLSGRAGSVLAVVVEPKAGDSLSDLLPEVQAAMQDFPGHLTELEVAREKKELYDDQRANLETSMGRARSIVDPHARTSWELDDYERIDRAAVVDAMHWFLSPEQRVTMVVRAATQPLYGAAGVVVHRDRMVR